MPIEDLFHDGAIHRNLRFLRVAWVLHNQENQIANIIINKESVIGHAVSRWEQRRKIACARVG